MLRPVSKATAHNECGLQVRAVVVLEPRATDGKFRSPRGPLATDVCSAGGRIGLQPGCYSVFWLFPIVIVHLKVIFKSYFINYNAMFIS